MKKLIAMLALTIISNQATAGSYTDAANADYYCKQMGDASKSGYRMKQHGRSLEEFRQRLNDNPKVTLKEEIYNIYKAGYEADSEDEAYILGWGHCMDDES